MKKKIRVLSCIMLFLLAAIPTCTAQETEQTTVKESMVGPELHLGIFGASIAGTRRAGFVISNTGDQSAADIEWVFSIKGIVTNQMDYSYSDTRDSLRHNAAIMFETNELYGFGLVTLTLSVSSSNAGDDTLSVKGFQIGQYTIRRPWILAWYGP